MALSVRQKYNELKNIFISVQIYTLIRLISAGVSEIIRFECSNSLWILKFIQGNKCAVHVGPRLRLRLGLFHLNHFRSHQCHLVLSSPFSLNQSLPHQFLLHGCSLSLSSESLSSQIGVTSGPVSFRMFNCGRWS